MTAIRANPELEVFIRKVAKEAIDMDMLPSKRVMEVLEISRPLFASIRNGIRPISPKVARKIIIYAPRTSLKRLMFPDLFPAKPKK